MRTIFEKGWLAIAKLKPLSLFIFPLLMFQKAFDNVKIEESESGFSSAIASQLFVVSRYFENRVEYF